MAEHNTEGMKSHFSSRTMLIGLGLNVSELGILETIRQKVQIKQKTVLDSPLDKLTDGLITILAGDQGLVEVNKRVRPDRAVQLVFGRSRCAEQSVISETLNACTTENVSQMGEALQAIYRQHSQGYRHNYEQDWQVLDIDLSGQPCGPKAAFATKGYFAHQRNRRGRQIGRVLASWYNEIVVEQLYAGNIALTSVLPELVETAAAILASDRTKRQRTLLRIDGHGGSQAQVQALVAQGYQVLTKEYSAVRAGHLADQVARWYDDPKEPGRQVGWVTAPTDPLTDQVLYRVAVRTQRKNGQWATGVLVSTLPPEAAAYLAGLSADALNPDLFALLAYLYCYDLRGGGIETAFRQDKQALGLTKRNKKRFEAQQILLQLNTLAHNLLVWFQQWLAPACPWVRQLGLLRLIREVIHFNGRIFFDQQQAVSLIVLSSHEP